MSEIIWEEKDSTFLREFLDTTTGQRFLPWLIHNRPSISAKDHLNSPQPMQAAALMGYKAEGWEESAQFIAGMASGNRNAYKPL